MNGPKIWKADIRTHFDSSLRCVARSSANSNRRCWRVMQHETGIITSTHAFRTPHTLSLHRSTNIGNCGRKKKLKKRTIPIFSYAQQPETLENFNSIEEIISLFLGGIDAMHSFQSNEIANEFKGKMSSFCYFLHGGRRGSCKETYQFPKKSFPADSGAKFSKVRRAEFPRIEFLVFAEGDVSVQKNLFCQLFANERCHLAHELR